MKRINLTHDQKVRIIKGTIIVVGIAGCVASGMLGSAIIVSVPLLP